MAQVTNAHSRTKRLLAGLPFLALLIGFAVYIALATSSPTVPPPPATGTVSGTLQEYGISPTPIGPLPGIVTLTSNTGLKYTVRSSGGGMLTVRVPTGTYTAVGYSPLVLSEGTQLRCQTSGPFVVNRAATTQVVVICLAF